jgi:predicted RNA binding protein YcfA (HicA-like mRNA interferase family)
MYNAVRLGMGVKETAGVGIITKQNTTKDVKPGTLKKMMKKLRLA